MKSTTLVMMLSLLFLGFACDKEPEPEPEQKPYVQITGGSVEEGSAVGKITFTISLSGTYSQPVTMDYRTADGTAVAGEDYVAVSGSITIPSGEISQTVDVEIIDDDVRESDETFTVVIENAVNATILSNSAVGTIVNDDFGFSFGGKSSPTSYPGYTLTWADEFDGPTLNLANWSYEIGRGSNGWGNNELQYYREENTSIEDGNLVIEARAESFSGANYTSSRLVTMDKQSFKYGRIDIRAVMPEGQGLWPALWMLGSNFKTVGWPSCGEIDIMEMIGGNNRENTVHGTVHWDNNGSYASYGQSTSKPTGTLADEYHVYSIIWDESAIRWLFDDVQYNVIDITPAGLSEFRNDFFFIFNVAVGGNWPGNPNSSTVFPQRMIVDYVRVFEKS